MALSFLVSIILHSSPFRLGPMVLWILPLAIPYIVNCIYFQHIDIAMAISGLATGNSSMHRPILDTLLNQIVGFLRPFCPVDGGQCVWMRSISYRELHSRASSPQAFLRHRERIMFPRWLPSWRTDIKELNSTRTISFLALCCCNTLLQCAEYSAVYWSAWLKLWYIEKHTRVLGEYTCRQKQLFLFLSLVFQKLYYNFGPWSVNGKL